MTKAELNLTARTIQQSHTSVEIQPSTFTEALVRSSDLQGEQTRLTGGMLRSLNSILEVVGDRPFTRRQKTTDAGPGHPNLQQLGGRP